MSKNEKTKSEKKSKSEKNMQDSFSHDSNEGEEETEINTSRDTRIIKTIYTELDDEKESKCNTENLDIRKALYVTLTNGICYDAFSLIAAEYGIKTGFSSSFYLLQN